MNSTRHALITAGLLALGALAVGIPTARKTVTAPPVEGAALRGAGARVHAELARLEGLVPAGRIREDGLWAVHLRVVDAELARGRVDLAVFRWRDAYGAALESRTWEGMIAVGDAFVRIGRAAGTPGGARTNAREAYLVALIRARRDHSVEGALESADAFRTLGDRATAGLALHIAAQLSAGNEPASVRVREARQRWATADAAPVF